MVLYTCPVLMNLPVLLVPFACACVPSYIILNDPSPLTLMILQCTLYFDKEKVPTSEDTLATLGITSQGTKTGFDAAATTAEGVFEMEDDYGTSYYYRGAVTIQLLLFSVYSYRYKTMYPTLHFHILYLLYSPCTMHLRHKMRAQRL